MKRIFIICAMSFVCHSSVFAQFDSIANSFRQEFEQFRQDIEQEHQQFSHRNDSIFARFLTDSWEEFEVFYKEIQEPPKPVIQPEIKADTVKSSQEIIPTPGDSTPSNISPRVKIEKNSVKMPVEPLEKSSRAMLNFDFYGAKTTAVHPGELPSVQHISEKNIEFYFKTASNLHTVSELIRELQQIRKKMRLNDWGYYKLTEQAVRSVEKSGYRQTLLAWVVMLKSGFNVKTGFTDNEIFLMLPAREEIFSSYYLTIDGIPYYIQTDREKNKPLPRLHVHKADYPGNIPISMRLNDIPLLGNNHMEKKFPFMGDTTGISLNKWLMDFYSEYPHCDLSVYFSTPLSAEMVQSLDVYFKPKLTGKTEKQKVAFLLDFVQDAFAYKTDGDQFGIEKYFFPDELFYYPFSDCEDRSVLFARLVTRYTAYDCIGLDFPGHVNTAVRITEEIEGGSFVRFNNKKYLVCDPTYVGAPVGYLDERYEKYNPKIITFTK